MSNIWELEYLRRKKLEEDAIKANEARQKNIDKNLRNFDGRNFLSPSKPDGIKIPNSTTFNPYTPYEPSLPESTRIRDEVNLILNRQDALDAKNYGPQTEEGFADWNKRVKGQYDVDKFNVGRKETVDRALANDEANRARQAGIDDANRRIAEYQRNKNNVIQLPGTVDEIYNSPMGKKQRQFNATDFGPDSTEARLRKQARTERTPVWDNIGPQTVDDYVEWLKKQGRMREAYDIEWENRRPVDLKFGETPEQTRNRNEAAKQQNKIDVERGRVINGPGFVVEKSPLQITQDTARTEWERIKAENDAFWNKVDRERRDKSQKINGVDALSNAERAALRGKLRSNEIDFTVPDLSGGRNRDLSGKAEPGLNRIPQNRTGVSNIIPTRNRFNREPINLVDPYSGSGEYGGTGFNRLPNGPQGPNGGLDIDQIMRPKPNKLQNLVGAGIGAFGVANGGGFGIPQMGGNDFSDNLSIQRPKNRELPGGTRREPVKGGGESSTVPVRPYISNGRGGSSNTPLIQKIGTPFNRGVGVAGGLNQLLQEAKLWNDAVDTMQDYNSTLKNLGVTKEELKKLEQYGNPKYVNGLEKSVNMSSGAKPYDGLSVNDIYDRVRAMRRGENPDRFKERVYGPQTKEGAELYRSDYRNGPIFRPGGKGFQFNPFKPGFGPTELDGYTDEQREGLDNARRRSVGSYYGRGLGDKLAELGRKVSSNYYNDYKQVLKNEKRKQQLEKDESRRNRRYWDDLDRNPNKQSRQRGLDRESRRNLQDYEEESRKLDAERERNRDPFKAQRESDLQKTLDWNKANPQRESFQDKQRRQTLEYWQKNDPSKIEGLWEPFKPVPPQDPDRDPDYPPLPPGLKYPVWGWSIEAFSSSGVGGLTVPIFWYSEYIKDASWVGDMPEPYADNYDGNSIIKNTGGWQYGRTGLVVLDNLKFGSPPQFTGSDEREIITEAEGREKWGIAWDFGDSDPRWINSPLRSRQKEILEDVRRVPYKGKSNFVPGSTTITKKTPIRGKQPVPDTSPQNPPKPEPEDPIMPGCSYQPDKQNPAVVSWWDKLTNSIKKKPIQVHEGVDEGFEHVSLQMAQLQEQINKISLVLDVDKYTSPQGKVVAPVLGMQAVTTVLGSTNPLAPIPLVKTLPQENLIFAAVNYMFSGHHLLGKMQLPIDPNKGADALGNMQRVTPLTSMGYMHQMYNNITGMIGMPSSHSVLDANGVKSPLQFKNQSDATENIHNNTVQMQQDISSLQEAVFKILQNQEMIVNMSHKIGYQAQFLMDDTGARVKNVMVQRPTVMKHGKKPDPLLQTGTTREFNWGNVFAMGTAATSVPTWDKSNDLDKMQLGLKTNIEAQKAASSNFYPISPKADTQAIPSLKSKRDGTWESYVKTINDGSEGKIYHGIAVPESKIEYIKNGVKREIVTSNKPFIDGREIE